MKKIMAIILILIFNGTIIHAEERKIMKVGFEDFPPSATMKDGKAVGIDVEILELAMNAVGVKVEFVMMPWSRCILMLDNGEIDAVIPMVYSKEREKRYTLGTSLRTRGNVIVLKRDIKKDVKTLDDLTGMTIGTGQNYVINKEFDEALNFKKERVATSEKMNEKKKKKVVFGRNDGAVMDIDSLKILAKKFKIENKIKISEIVYTKESHVGFTKDNRFYKLYEKGFKIIKGNRELENILKKWDLKTRY